MSYKASKLEKALEAQFYPLLLTLGNIQKLENDNLGYSRSIVSCHSYIILFVCGTLKKFWMGNERKQEEFSSRYWDMVTTCSHLTQALCNGSPA